MSKKARRVAASAVSTTATITPPSPCGCAVVGVHHGHHPPPLALYSFWGPYIDSRGGWRLRFLVREHGLLFRAHGAAQRGHAMLAAHGRSRPSRTEVHLSVGPDPAGERDKRPVRGPAAGRAGRRPSTELPRA